MKLDYDGIQYARESEVNNAQARLVHSLLDAMRDGDIPNVPISFEWVICDYCQGNGGHSRHLGMISQDTWNDWGDESRERYLSGAYDTACTACSNTGKTREIALDTLPSAVVTWIDNYWENVYESASARYHERLAGC
jgi:hypothetical protein